MKKILIGTVVFFIVVVLAMGYAISTEKGLVILVRSLEKISRGSLSVSDVKGKVLGRFSLEKLSYESSDTLFKLNHFEFFWNPAELRRGNLHVFSCVIEDVEYIDTVLRDDEDSGTVDLSLPNLKLPFHLLLDDLRVRNVQVISNENTVAELDRIDLQMTGDGAFLQFNTVYLQGSEYEINLSGNVGLDEGWPVDITGKWRYLIEGVPELQGTIEIVDSLKDAGVELVLEAPYAARLGGRIQLRDGGVSWQALLKTDEVNPAIVYSELPGLLDIHVAAKGMWKEETLSAAFTFEHVEGTLLTRPVDLGGTVIYDGEQLQINDVVLKSNEAGITINGKLSDTVDLSYIFHPLEVNLVVPEISGVFNGEGTVSGKISTPVITTVLEGNELKGQDFAVGKVNADIKVEIQENLQKSKIDAAVMVKDIRYDNQYVDRSVVGVVGSLEKHTLHLEAFRDVFSAIVSADGGWNGSEWKGHLTKLNLVNEGKEAIKLERPVPISAGVNNVEVGNMCLKHESSTLCLNGQLRDNKWNTEINVEKFNPGYFSEEWPGTLSVKARGEGLLSNDNLNYSFDVSSVTGFLKGVSVNGGGTISQSGKIFKLHELRLFYGDAQVKAEGELSDSYNLDFHIEVPELGKFSKEIGGQLNAYGTVYGEMKQPVMDLDINGKNIIYGDLEITSIYGDIGLDLKNEGRVEAIIRGSDITINGAQLSAVSFIANGTAANHLFMVDAETDFGTTQIQGKGKYITSWQGVLESGRFALKEYGTWTLQKDSALEIGGEKISLEELCLYADEAHLCLQGALLDGNDWSARARIESTPLRMLKNAGLGDIPLQGKFEGSVDASGDLDGISSFKAKVTAGQILLQDRWQDDVQYIFSENAVSAALEGDSLRVTLGSRFQESDTISGSFSILNIQESTKNIASLPLTGAVDFNVGNISFVSILTDDRYQPKGRLQGKLDIAGVLGEPIVEGKVSLENGEVLVADLGILLQDISIGLRSQNNVLNYTLKARSGPGNILSDGVVTFEGSNGFMVSGAITGKEFEIMNTDEYQFHISPDLQLEYGGSRASLNGSLKVPFGRINFQGVSATATSTDDVVIVDAVEPVERRDSQFFADVSVSLGDDVKVNAYGLKSDLVGDFRLINSPGKNLSAQGELVVLNGQFSLYSAELDITRGRLFFTTGSVENPGVDFRAQRKIGEKLVGVNVSGTAKDYEFQLFSEPPMEESNILAYILFGRAMYDSSGAETSFVDAAANALGIRGVNTVTNKLGKYVPVDEFYLEGDANEEDLSIVLGKHLTKDLFIGYGHNLFNELGEFKVKYQLGNNFSVETKSSVESTSGDIIYTIEK